jgi:RNA polymerase sigma factor (sigma-70 family)
MDQVSSRDAVQILELDGSAAAEMTRLNGLLLAVGQRQDRAAFMALFQHFAPRLKAWLQRQGSDPGTAEEIVQDVMVSVWRRADSFDPALASAGTWMFTIARNRRIDLLRRERRPELDPHDPALVPAATEPADRTIDLSQQADRLRQAMRDLPAEQVDLLNLAFFQDMAHSAIAAARNLPLGTVKSRLRLAMVRLRKALGDLE